MAQLPRSCREEKDMPCSNNVCKYQSFGLKSVEHNAVPLVGNSYSAQIQRAGFDPQSLPRYVCTPTIIRAFNLIPKLFALKPTAIFKR
jgi:hypothetical protein